LVFLVTADGSGQSGGSESEDSIHSDPDCEVEFVREIDPKPVTENRKVLTGRWKLNADRLKEVLNVNQLAVRIRKIRFSQQFSARYNFSFDLYQ
jgi:hypothetical protein